MFWHLGSRNELFFICFCIKYMYISDKTNVFVTKLQILMQKHVFLKKITILRKKTFFFYKKRFL